MQTENKKNQAKFISLEGSEGVGKTTSLNFIKGYVESLGHQVLVTREPGGTPLAEEIRNLLLEKREENVDASAELLLMFASRIQHIENVIKPALNDGVWVVSDRFVDASYAYQGGGRGLGFERIEFIEKWSMGDFLPDLTLLLDMSVEDGMARTRLRGDSDRFEDEKITFFQTIRKAYLKRAEKSKGRIKIIDASPSAELVQQAIKKELELCL
ncbi:MAG: dTMP kinase [Gammaproteobacteria bacterium]|nr:MAG: dTMP kinase [Gammaproteobacteria bacterium]